MMIELYQRANCPSCKRVRDKLEDLGLDYVVRSVPKLGSERRRLLELGDSATVPVLKDGHELIRDATRIVEWLDDRYGRPGFGDPRYGLTRVIEGAAIDEVEAAVTEALKAEGFGVLTRIDVRETLRNKLDVDHPEYRILGACNPPLAHQALTGEPAVGLLLPCNVVVADQPDGSVALSAIDPDRLLAVVGRDDLKPLAKDVGARLRRALANVRATD